MNYTFQTKTISYIIEVIISLVILFIEYVIINDNSNMTAFFEVQLLVVWGYAQYMSYKQFGTFNLFSLILASTFLFSIGGVLHFLISGEDIRYLNNRGFGDFSFSNTIIQESLLMYAIFIWLSFVTYKHKFSTNPTNNVLIEKYKTGQYGQAYFKIGKFLMFAFLWTMIYKGYLYVNSFSMDRILIFLNGNLDNPVPTWVRFLATFYEIGYFFIIASKPDKKLFKQYSSLYFFSIIPDIILGNRMAFGAFILFYCWYYAKMYDTRIIKRKYIILAVIGLLLIFQGMEFIRDGMTLSKSHFSLTSFLVGQSVSFYILPIYITYSGSILYYHYPFILYNIIGGFSGYTGQSIEVLEHNCGVGHQLIYTVNPDYYLMGASFGSNNIVELYDIGVVGVILGAIFLPYMLRFFEKKINSSHFWLFMSLMIVSHFVTFSRGSYFPSLYLIVKYFIFYQFILGIFKLTKMYKSYRE